MVVALEPWLRERRQRWRGRRDADGRRRQRGDAGQAAGFRKTSNPAA